MKVKTSARSAERALELASKQLARGDLDTAERTLRRLLDWQSESGDAWHLLSVTVNTNGRPADAIRFAESAIALDASRPEFHASHGRALKSANRLDDAIAAYERALALRPGYAEVWVSLGIALRLQGRLDEAIPRYREALRLRPEFPEALSNLGNALAERIAREVGGRLTAEDLREAEQVQRRALALAPRNPNLLHNLGLVLKLTGRYEESADVLNQALGLDRARVDTCLQFGDLLIKESRFDLARQLFTRWLLENPPHPRVMIALASTLAELGEADESLAWLARVEAADPASPEARHIRGRVLQQRFDADLDARQTLAAFRSAIDARPDYFEAICSYLLTLCYVEDDPAVLAAEHRARIAPLGPARREAPSPAAPLARRIRIGYVSHDLKRHSVAYFLEGILEAHDHSRFEIFGYKTNASGDAVTERLKSLCDHWVECGHFSDAQCADRIRADGIDILIDLSGLTSGARLGVFQLRPAPCQITYLGYPTTTGAACFDFRITDSIIDPAGADDHSTEPLLRCPHSMFCYRPGKKPEVADLPAFRHGHVTFGSFNNLSKAGPGTMELWRGVLHAVPGSRLRLKAQALVQQGNQRFIRQYFADGGIDPERIVVQAWSPDVQDHFAAYHELDIALDTTPFNGATTTCEALDMGVPVVTLAGRTHPSRMGASILGAAGLPELVAHDAAHYVSIAAAIARDLPRLSALRSGMRARLRQSRLFDRAAFTHDFESLLDEALERVLRTPRDDDLAA